MARRYTQMTFTAGPKRIQENHGVRGTTRRMEEASIEDSVFSVREQQFIEARDSFYVATVLESGWPYLQHRGGPAGFLRVLDDRTLGFADFRGNLQYITVGNVESDDRVALFLMDYGGRKRLKIMAKMEVREAADHPDLVARLKSPRYRARIERVVLFHLEAFDWNCPQHITQRFTESEWLER